MPILQDLASYAGALRVVSRDAEGVKWSQSLEELAKHPETPAANPKKNHADYLDEVLGEIEWFDRVGGAAQMFFKDKWLTMLAARTSRSVVDSLRRDRRNIEAELLKLHAVHARAWVERVLKFSQPDLKLFLKSALASLRERFHNDLELLVSTAIAGAALPTEAKVELLRAMQILTLTLKPGDLGGVERTTPPDSYPLLQFGLTFGCAPAPGYVELPAEGDAKHDLELIDAALPRSQVIIYDLATLLGGFAGSVESGLNYMIVSKLDTIHEANAGDIGGLPPAGPPAADLPVADQPSTGPPAAGPLDAGVRYLRLDSSDRHRARAIVSKRPLDEIRAGPSPALWRYHELVEDSITESAGFLLENAEAVIDSFTEEEGGAVIQRLEQKRLQAELYHIRRYYRGAEVPQAARMAASTIAASRLSNTELVLDQKLLSEWLPGERAARRRELTLTYLAQAKRLEELLSRVPTESATLRPYSAIEQMATLKLLEDGGRLPSIKATCFAVGRGVVLD